MKVHRGGPGQSCDGLGIDAYKRRKARGREMPEKGKQEKGARQKSASRDAQHRPPLTQLSLLHSFSIMVCVAQCSLRSFFW